MEPPAKHAPLPQFPDVQMAVTKLIESLAEIAATIATEVPKHLALVTMELAKRGWYMNDDMDFGQTSHVQDLLAASNKAEVDEYMTPIVRERIPGTIKLIQDRFPKRLPIVSVAIEAHAHGEYAVAIPCLLIQAEGVCIDLLKSNLFGTKHSIPKIRIALDQYQQDEDDWMLSSVLHPFKTDVGIIASQEHRHLYPDVMNRHEIIHGLDIDYATEPNSLKAISLLDYVATVIWEVRAAAVKKEVAPLF